MPQKAQRCDLEIEFLEVQGATIVVPDLTNCQVRGDVPVFCLRTWHQRNMIPTQKTCIEDAAKFVWQPTLSWGTLV